MRRIGAQLGGVEGVTDLSEKYKGIVIAKVISCEPHPDSDHLHVCEIDPGDAAEFSKFKIQNSRFVQVVCGAPNVRAGMFVAWLPPGNTVPASYDKDPFVLDVRKIRGVESNGMLASPAELAIGDNHEGILEITEADLPRLMSRDSRPELKPGLNFAETFGLNDTVIDIENKMFTHRPDCFGQLGVAREIAGILGQPFTSPDWYLQASREPQDADTEGVPLGLRVFNEAKEKVPRFMAVAISGVTVRPSPFWLQCELVRLGGKPINNIVDLTNYLMLLTAQPTHAYDYDNLRGATLGVRMAKEGEKLIVLNGKTYQLTGNDIVIVDGEGPVGLGGVMGGGNSEVSPGTKNIVLEVATFDMYTIRKTSMRYGLFTDAVTRFNKGQSPLQNPFILARLQQLMTELTGGVQASSVYDEVREDVAARTESLDGASPITLAPQFIRDRLGIDMKKYDMVQLLGNVEFPACQDCGWNPDDTVDNNEPLHINIPFWRTDVELPEDVVEEIGRLYGFDKLPHELPQRSILPTPQNPNLEMKRKVSRLLSSAGANEVKTYSFVHERVLQGAGQDPEQAFRLGNALSPDLQYYRLSLTPSLLAHVHGNIKAGHDEFALYEFGKAHNKKEYDDEALPREIHELAFVCAAKKPLSGAPYYLAKRYLDRLLKMHGVHNLRYEKLEEADLYDNPRLAQMTAPFDPRRSAVVRATDDSLGQTKNLVWGVVGEYKPATARAFKLPEYAAGFELDPLMFTWAQGRSYQPLSRFPHVAQDISLRVPVATTYAELFQTADNTLKPLRSETLSLELSPLDIYQADSAETKTITLRLRATNYDRTLTDAEVTTYLDAIAAATTALHSGTRV